MRGLEPPLHTTSCTSWVCEGSCLQGVCQNHAEIRGPILRRLRGEKNRHAAPSTSPVRLRGHRMNLLVDCFSHV